jgi:hypothetical protein
LPMCEIFIALLLPRGVDRTLRLKCAWDSSKWFLRLFSLLPTQAGFPRRSERQAHEGPNLGAPRSNPSCCHPTRWSLAV